MLNYTTHISDRPGWALIASLFSGPLGLQGYLIDPSNPKYGTTGKHQRRTVWALWTILLILIIIAGFFLLKYNKSFPEDDRDIEVNNRLGIGLILEIAKPFPSMAHWAMLLSVALSITVFISFIMACNIYGKS